MPGEKAMFGALFECDSLNRVILRELSEQKSKNVQTGFDFKDGRLNYKAQTTPDTVWMPADTVYIERDVPLVVEAPRIEYRQTKAERFFSVAGMFALVTVIGWVGIKIRAGSLLKIITKLFK